MGRSRVSTTMAERSGKGHALSICGSVDPELGSGAVYANSFRTVEASIASTGLRTHPLRCDALRPMQGPRVAEEFLLTSKLRRRDIYDTMPCFTSSSAISRPVQWLMGRPAC